MSRSAVANTTTKDHREVGGEVGSEAGLRRPDTLAAGGKVEVGANEVGLRRPGAEAAAVVVFYGCFLVIEARGGTWFRTPCPNCRAKPSKVLAAAPRPREKGRFRVAISDRPPSPPRTAY